MYTMMGFFVGDFSCNEAMNMEMKRCVNTSHQVTSQHHVISISHVGVPNTIRD